MATEIIPGAVAEKEAALQARLAACGTLLIAYSGGVDSSYLADVAHDCLGDAARLVLADISQSDLCDFSTQVVSDRLGHVVVAHGPGLVPGGLHDAPVGYAGQQGGGDEAATQRMPCDSLRLELRQGGKPLDHQSRP